MFTKLQQDHRRREVEMQIVEQARAQSRAETAKLEELKHEARAVYLHNPAATEADFERCWPQLCSEIQRRRARATC